MASQSFADDVAQEFGGAEPIVLQDVVGRAVEPFGVEDGTGEIRIRTLGTPSASSLKSMRQ